MEDSRPSALRGLARHSRLVPRRATTRPARQPGARPPAGGLDRLGREAAACDQPGDHRVGVPHLARCELVATPDGRRDVGNEVEDSLRAHLDHLSVAADSRLLRRRPGWLRHASGAPRSGRSGSAPPSGFRPHLRQRRHAPGRCRRGRAPARSRSVPPAPARRARSGRDRKAAVPRAALRPPRRRVRSAAPSGRPRRAGASRGRFRLPTLQTCRHPHHGSARSHRSRDRLGLRITRDGIGGFRRCLASASPLRCFQYGSRQGGISHGYLSRDTPNVVQAAAIAGPASAVKILALFLGIAVGVLAIVAVVLVQVADDARDEATAAAPAHDHASSAVSLPLQSFAGQDR